MVAVLACLAGCGSGDDEQATTSHSEAEIVKAAGLTSQGENYETPSGCAVSTVILGKPQIQVYKDAGSVVITTSDGTAGVELSTGTDSCREELEDAIADL